MEDAVRKCYLKICAAEQDLYYRQQTMELQMANREANMKIVENRSLQALELKNTLYGELQRKYPDLLGEVDLREQQQRYTTIDQAYARRKADDGLGGSTRAPQSTADRVEIHRVQKELSRLNSKLDEVRSKVTSAMSPQANALSLPGMYETPMHLAGPSQGVSQHPQQTRPIRHPVVSQFPDTVPVHQAPQDGLLQHAAQQDFIQQPQQVQLQQAPTLQPVQQQQYYQPPIQPPIQPQQSYQPPIQPPIQPQQSYQPTTQPIPQPVQQPAPAVVQQVLQQPYIQPQPVQSAVQAQPQVTQQQPQPVQKASKARSQAGPPKTQASFDSPPRFKFSLGVSKPTSPAAAAALQNVNSSSSSSESDDFEEKLSKMTSQKAPANVNESRSTAPKPQQQRSISKVPSVIKSDSSSSDDNLKPPPSNTPAPSSYAALVEKVKSGSSRVDLLDSDEDRKPAVGHKEPPKYDAFTVTKSTPAPAAIRKTLPAAKETPAITEPAVEKSAEKQEFLSKLFPDLFTGDKGAPPTTSTIANRKQNNDSDSSDFFD